MNESVREIADSADVVEVEVRHDDVANIGAPEAQCLDLARRGLGRIERRANHMPERTNPRRVLTVA